MKSISEALLDGDILQLDGAMGTMLQSTGLTSDGIMPDILNLTAPDDIAAIHKAYVDAGAQIITTNTFGSNRLKLGDKAAVEDIYIAAARNAREAGAAYVAGDIGPTGALLEPVGDFGFEEAIDVFSEQVRAIDRAGCDLILIETQTDLREAKAAVIAAKENSSLPVFVSMSFGEDGRTFLGTPPEAAAVTLSALGVQAVGMNCSLGPERMLALAERMIPYLRCPMLIRPNAGLPSIVGAQTVYDLTPGEFATSMEEFLRLGAKVVGGCCGTTPAHIEALSKAVAEISLSRDPRATSDSMHPAWNKSNKSNLFSVSSPTAVVSVDPTAYDIAVIGENINPTRRKGLKEALEDGDFDRIVSEALREQDCGADIIDVNVGVPGIDEPRTMGNAVEELQAIVSCPLQIDSSDPGAIEAGVRAYNGKPLINSVNGKPETLDSILPIAKKYGCAVLGLTLDENGIPPAAEERLAIAERIIDAAESYGIDRADIAIDCLVMTAATNQSEIPEILRALAAIKQKLGVATVLGVSNVSFGLPDRELLNAAFMSAAIGAGLDMPIINPCSRTYMDAVNALRVLNGQDEGSSHYIASSEERDSKVGHAHPTGIENANASNGAANLKESEFIASLDLPWQDDDARELVSALADFVLTGRSKAVTQDLMDMILSVIDGIEVIDRILVPVLDEVGRRYGGGLLYLPQLISSAEAAKHAFDAIKAKEGSGSNSDDASPDVIMATVKGDIHDIGKNIVVMLLENYGFDVLDLGFDVEPKQILEKAVETGAKLIGLSALMTTTLDSMQETIRLINKNIPEARVMVGGAVLTPEYSEAIGADYYSKDAAEAVRIAQDFFEERR